MLQVDRAGIRRLMHQYWSFAYQDCHLSARLLDNGIALGAAANGFSDADDLIPCQPPLGSISRYYALANGATLSVELGARHLSLVLEGQSVDLARRFRVEATADAA